METIKVDFSQKIKSFKEVNGVNNGPGLKKGGLDSSRFFSELDIHYSRLHDTNLLSPRHFVDFYRIFSDFSKDADDPANYDFRCTDRLIQKLLTLNVNIIYRLGPSATLKNEDNHASFPCDVEKLSKVFMHIVDHYVGGWANGFHYPIRMWEFWNEPDLPQFLKESEETFFELYRLFSLKAKAKYPDLQIGGCAFSCGTSPRAEHFLDFVKANDLPLDFFSFHKYASSPDAIKEHIYNAKELLIAKGFGDVPTVFDEWNFNINFGDRLNESYLNIGRINGACLTAGGLCELQKGPVDIATYYDMQTNYMMLCYNGIYWSDGFRLIRKKPYYAFLYFKKLKELGTEVFISDLPNVYTLAASDGEHHRMMIINFSFEKPAERTVSLDVVGNGAQNDSQGFTHMSVYITDKHNTNRCIYEGAPCQTLVLPTNSIQYIEFT